MKKQFYSHIIEISPLYTALDGMELNSEEKNHLLKLIESSVHHAILDTLLSELTDEHKKILLSLIVRNEHNDAWKLVITNIPEAEKKIRQRAQTLIEDLQTDIHEAKQKR